MTHPNLSPPRPQPPTLDTESLIETIRHGIREENARTNTLNTLSQNPSPLLHNSPTHITRKYTYLRIYTKTIPILISIPPRYSPHDIHFRNPYNANTLPTEPLQPSHLANNHFILNNHQTILNIHTDLDNPPVTPVTREEFRAFARIPVHQLTEVETRRFLQCLDTLYL